jgi:hypothetical protein
MGHIPIIRSTVELWQLRPRQANGISGNLPGISNLYIIPVHISLRESAE